jgi:hypothetical protein
MVMLSVFFPLSEAIKQLILANMPDGYRVWYFPFQLCSMPAYLLPLAMLTRNDKMKKLLLCFLGDFMLVGGVAVLFDTSGMFYDVPILTVHSFLWHGRMILLALLILTGTDYDTASGMSVKESMLYLFLALAAQAFNILLRGFGRIDMFYISPFTKMRQVVFSDIAGALGDIPAKAIYMMATLIAAMLVKQAVRIIKLRRR